MIRTGITYRFKQRVTEAGIFPGFFYGAFLENETPGIRAYKNRMLHILQCN